MGLETQIIIWGCGEHGAKAWTILSNYYDIVGWGDSDIHKQGLLFKNIPIYSRKDILEKYRDIPVVVAVAEYGDLAASLKHAGVNVIGYFDAEIGYVLPCNRLSWKDVEGKELKLYAGDLPSNRRYQFPNDMICLSITRSNFYTIKHDITSLLPIPSDCVVFYEAEDVLEHIEKEKFISVINEIYRVLKPSSHLRVSLPDYHCPTLRGNSFVDPKTGEVVFDPKGGGNFNGGKISEGGHLWFPTIDVVREMLAKTNFKKVIFYLYFNRDGTKYKIPIDYSKGYISRTIESGFDDWVMIFDAFKD